MEKFLEKIQNASPEKKKKWLIILTGISMAFIVMAWVYYMNYFVFKPSAPETNQQIEIGFWPTFKAGIAATIESAESNLKDFASNIMLKIPSFGKEKTITIENPGN